MEVHQLAGLLNISKRKVGNWFRKKRCEGRHVRSLQMGKQSSAKYTNSADTGVMFSELM